MSQVTFNNEEVTFETIKEWLLSTEGNVQYRAKVVKVGSSSSYVSLAKYTKGPADPYYKPCRKQVFLPANAFFEFETKIHEISNEFRKLSLSTPGMFTKHEIIL